MLEIAERACRYYCVHLDTNQRVTDRRTDNMDVVANVISRSACIVNKQQVDRLQSLKPKIDSKTKRSKLREIKAMRELKRR